MPTTYIFNLTRRLQTALLFAAGLALLILSAPSNALGDACSLRVIRVPIFEKYAKQNDVYFVQLLILALEKAQYRCGNFRVDFSTLSYSSRRYKAELAKNSGLINVLWSMGSAHLDQRFQRVDADVLKGMNGFRYLVVNRSDLEKFHTIRNLSELARYRAGQAVDWPDVEILRHNGITVVTSLYADNLYKMLQGRRFDFLPRAVHEAANELALHNNASVAQVDGLAINYPAPVYYYVNKQEVELADAIGRGLALANADGSWDKLFFGFPGFAKAYQQMQQSDIRVIRLEASLSQQPNLPPPYYSSSSHAMGPLRKALDFCGTHRAGDIFAQLQLAPLAVARIKQQHSSAQAVAETGD